MTTSQQVSDWCSRNCTKSMCYDWSLLLLIQTKFTSFPNTHQISHIQHCNDNGEILESTRCSGRDGKHMKSSSAFQAYITIESWSNIENNRGYLVCQEDDTYISVGTMSSTKFTLYTPVESWPHHQTNHLEFSPKWRSMCFEVCQAWCDLSTSVIRTDHIRGILITWM